MIKRSTTFQFAGNNLPTKRLLVSSALILVIATGCGGGGGGGSSSSSVSAATQPTVSNTIPSTTTGTSSTAATPIAHVAWTPPANETQFPFARVGNGDGTATNGSHIVSNDGRYIFFATLQQDGSTNAPGYFNIYRSDLMAGTTTRFFDWSTQIGTGYAAFYGHGSLTTSASVQAFVSLDGQTTVFSTSLEDPNTASTGTEYGPYFFITSSATGTVQTKSVLAVDQIIDDFDVSQDAKTIAVTVNSGIFNDDRESVRIYANGAWSALVSPGVHLGKSIIPWDDHAVFYPEAGILVDTRSMAVVRAQALVPSNGIDAPAKIYNGNSYYAGSLIEEFSGDNPLAKTEADPATLSIAGVPSGTEVVEMASSDLALLSAYPQSYLVNLRSKTLIAKIFADGLSENGAYYWTNCTAGAGVVCFDVYRSGVTPVATTGFFTIP